MRKLLLLGLFLTPLVVFGQSVDSVKPDAVQERSQDTLQYYRLQKKHRQKQPEIERDVLSTPPQEVPTKREDTTVIFVKKITTNESQLLSARDILHISYTAFEMGTAAERPPSVLVADLLGTLDAMFAWSDGKSAAKRFRISHRLHAFHPAYFNGHLPRSFSESSLEASRNWRGPTT